MADSMPDNAAVVDRKEASGLERIALQMYEAIHPDANWFDVHEDARKAGIRVLGDEIGALKTKCQNLETDNQRLAAECEKLRDNIGKLTAIAERQIAMSATLGRLHPKSTSSYDGTCNLFLTLVFNGLQYGFGISPHSVIIAFRNLMQTVITEQYPSGLRRSALRQVLEGDLTDGVCPVSAIPIGLRSRVEQVLGFADACETLLYHKAGVTEQGVPHGQGEADEQVRPAGQE